MDTTTLFCNIDDFIKGEYLHMGGSVQIKPSQEKTGPNNLMSLSEIMTILVLYHSSGFKNFKAYYLTLLNTRQGAFQRLLSYSRFIECTPYALLPLTAFIKTKMGQCTGISFIDSTPLKVCHNIRINRNKVFAGIAKRGVSSMGWFFGLKLHFTVNEVGEILSLQITRGNVHDTVAVADLCKNLKGKIYGDKGYLIKAELFEELFGNGLQMVTNIKSNMKNKLVPIMDKLMLRKRFIIETINDQLKNISDIEHSRHRSPVNCLVNIIAGLISYIYKENKPAIRWPKMSLMADPV